MASGVVRSGAIGAGCRAAVAWRDEPVLVGEDDGLDPVAQTQLREQARDVRLDRGDLDEQRGRDLRVGHPTGYQAQDVGLSGGEPGESGVGARGWTAPRELGD